MVLEHGTHYPVHGTQYMVYTRKLSCNCMFATENYRVSTKYHMVRKIPCTIYCSQQSYVSSTVNMFSLVRKWAERTPGSKQKKHFLIQFEIDILFLLLYFFCRKLIVAFFINTLKFYCSRTRKYGNYTGNGIISGKPQSIQKSLLQNSNIL